MSKRTLILLLSMLLLAAAAFGCRRPLYYIEKESIDVIVRVLWKVEVYPDGIKPDGVTLYFFRDGEYYMQKTTADVDSCSVRLEPGKYRFFMISQSPEEFGNLIFDHMTDFDNASVSVAETKNNWYTRAESEELINNPEMLVAGVSDEFEVSEEMEEETLKTKAEYRTVTIRVPVKPQSIVSQYWVTIYSDNADVLQSVRASTTGMARTFELTQNTTGEETATQFITHWTLTMDNPASRVGHVDGKITTFGFPNGEIPSSQRDSTLNVSALLIDNKTVEDYVFNVGDKITLQDAPEGFRALYRLVFGSVEAPEIHPPDVKPAEESSGFDANVSDWQEGDQVEVEM